MSFILPINCGYYGFKSLSNQYFKTRLSEIPHGKVKTNNDIIKFEDKYYIVGHGKKNLNLNKTDDDFLKICILNMCARFMTTEYQDFKLLLTSPALTFKESEILLPQQLIDGYEIYHNDVKRIITISECTVFPETFPVYLSNNPEQYENKILYIIDIGGYTSSICKISNCDFNPYEDFVSIVHGNYDIDTQIRDYLISTEHIPCDLEDIFIYKQNNFNDLCNDLRGIHSIYSSFLDELLEETKIKGWNLKKGCEILVTGGGGLDIFPFIKEKYFNHAKLSNNPIYNNLNSLEVIAKEMYGNDYPN